MARIVMGLGTSHGSQVSIGPEWWPKHGELDRKRTPYDELVAAAPASLAGELTPEVWQRKYDQVQAAVAELGRSLRETAPDVLVAIGDDQSEIYRERNMPAISVFWADEMLDIPRDPANVPPSRAASLWAKHAPVETAYPVPAKLGLHVIESLVGAGFDVAQISDQPEGRSIGHAFTFVRLRLMGERPIPMLPVMLNTYFPPNQPPARRCYALGRALREALLSWPEGISVGVVASGGLSHFVVDEELDRGLLDAIANQDAAHIEAIPESKLQSGSSEIKNWIVAAGALTDLRFEVVDYVPGYRSPAGTGCGMAFARWC
jgi:catalytic LigB subunit of aromatic ring-opening dioxygenase